MNASASSHESTSNDKDTEKTAEILNKPSRPTRRKKVFRFLLLGMFVAAIACSIPYYLRSLAYESTDDAFIDGNIIPVSPRVTGHVTHVLVNDNQWVKSGDLLLELDRRDFETRLNAAEAALEAAKALERTRHIDVELTRITATANLDEAKDNVEAKKAVLQEASARRSLAKATLEQLEAEADSANARYQLDVTDLERYREMARTQAVSRQDFDHKEAAERISRAALTAAKKKINTQMAAIQEAEAALKAAQAEVRQALARMAAAQSAPQQIQRNVSQAEVSGADIQRAEAEMNQARLNLSYTRILSPTDGFVTKKAVEPGQFTQAGQSLLAIVPKALWVTANFKETQLTHMRAGQPVDITVDAYPDLILHGRVGSFQHGTGARFSLLPAENATGNYVKVVQRVPVKILLSQSESMRTLLLVPGMSVVPRVNIENTDPPPLPSDKATAEETLTPKEKRVAVTP